ncbi:hypothetical protein LCGC14_2939640, partial [marine sediment metagenome]
MKTDRICAYQFKMLESEDDIRGFAVGIQRPGRLAYLKEDGSETFNEHHAFIGPKHEATALMRELKGYEWQFSVLIPADSHQKTW